jgi:NADPH-dependent glutamate synthase beta subunit-like oxidoreductase
VREAADSLAAGKARIIAGGTDLLGSLKDNILPEYPARVVNIKSIPGLDYIAEDGEAEGGGLRVGALTRLADIADSPLIRAKYPALAQSAESVATPHVRDMATIGGNLAQLPRCWYFRKPENRFYCIRKGGKECFALTGDSRYHSAFGGRRVSVTPCAMECPAGTDIPGYLAKIREGDWDGAAEMILAVNPMPAITARVCAHFCQPVCNRGESGDGVLISGVERALGDYILANSERFYAPPERETGKSAAVAGSGPSGLSAAYFLRKAGNRVTVYDSKPEAGGMLMYAIPAYRLPKDVVRRFVRALEGMGVVFELNTRVGEELLPEDLERRYDSVCFATGAWKRPVVGISGEELTVFGLDFLVEVNQWMEGKVGSEVLVTGGGNVAMDVAVTAKRLGAERVTMACLEPRDRMPASADEIARAEAEGIVIMPSLGLGAVLEENGVVKGMELKRCVSPWDETGAFNPQYDENEKTVIRAENILMAVGQRVDLSFLSEGFQLQLNRRGLIDVEKETGMTSRKGVFAGGDAATGPATVIGSVANGRIAADGMNRYLGAAAVGGSAVGGAGGDRSAAAAAGGGVPSAGRDLGAAGGDGAANGGSTGGGSGSCGAGAADNANGVNNTDGANRAAGVNRDSGSSLGSGVVGSLTGGSAGEGTGAATGSAAGGPGGDSAGSGVIDGLASGGAAFIGFDPEGIQETKALKLKELDADKRRLDLEDSVSPTAAEAAREARRCLNCGCYAVAPSDIAPALVALRAIVVTDRRQVDAEDFFTVGLPDCTVLDFDEVVTEIRIPAPVRESLSAFVKFAFRKSIDFSVVSCAVDLSGDTPRICLGGVAPVPFRAFAAEALLAGKPVDTALAEAVGEAAVGGAKPFESTRYKTQLAKVMVKRALLAAAFGETSPEQA